MGPGGLSAGTPVARPARAAAFALVAALAVASAGCATDEGPRADPLELEPGGWIDPERTLAASEAGFDAYAADVRARMASFRVPLDPDDAARELELAAPREYRPAPSCGDEVRGIAILVHGLADTAYSLADVAGTLAGRCLIARTMLLPGHGTRSADLLEVDHEDWLASVERLVDAASLEHENVLLAGVSLGAILGLTAALTPDSPIGALVSISPAWRLESARLVRFTPWLRHVWKWVDEDARDDWARYEAMPMNGIAETVLAIRALDERIEARTASGTDGGGALGIPWLVAQSADDVIVDGTANAALFERLAGAPDSLLIEFRTAAGDAARRAEGEDVPQDVYGTGLEGGDGEEGDAPKEASADAPPGAPAAGPRTVRVRGDDPELRVTSVTHLGVHVSPDNPHWGIDGDYRACSVNAPREPDAIAACLDAERPWFAGARVPAPAGEPSARGTFNPRYDVLEDALGAFVDAWLDVPEEASS